MTPAGSVVPATPAPSTDPAALYASIERQVETIRGLAPKRLVTPVLLDEAGLRAELQAHSAEDNPPAATAREQRLLKALGVLAPDADLAAVMNAFLSGQIAGFYRPKDGHLYVVSRSGAIGAAERTTFAHEYTHALQDQSFPLLQQLDGAGTAPRNGDRDLARLAIIEGDATLAMTVWAQDHLSPLELLDLLRSSFDPAQQAALAAMPPFLRDTVLFPYQAGLQFAMGLQLSGGWPAVNAAFTAPPASTEQVLHPDRYASHEAPVVVTLPTDLATRMGPGWTLDSEDTLGELRIRAWLAAVGDSGVPVGSGASPTPGSLAAASSAADGWGGDRVATLRGPGGAWALVLRTTWDTDRDAQEFANAVSAALAPGGRHGRLAAGASPREEWLVLAPSAELVLAAERAATGR